MTDEVMTPDQSYTDPYDSYDPYDTTAQPQTPPKASFRWFSPANVIIVIAVALILGIVSYGIYQNEQGAIEPGDEAPDFTLITYDEEEFRLSDHEGQNVVVINFWHNECPPCHQEAEDLQDVYVSYQGQDVVFIGVNVKDPERIAREFMTRYGVTYPNGLDRGDKINKDLYRTTGWPETFIINRQGIVTLHQVGPISSSKLSAEIDKALEQGS